MSHGLRRFHVGVPQASFDGARDPAPPMAVTTEQYGAPLVRPLS